MSWSDTQTRQMHDWYFIDGQSALTISKHFGVSKNVIVGHLTRSFPGKRKSQFKSPIVAPRKAAQGNGAGFGSHLAQAAPKRSLRLLELQSRSCRWPVAFDGERLFCGNP